MATSVTGVAIFLSLSNESKSVRYISILISLLLLFATPGISQNGCGDSSYHYSLHTSLADSFVLKKKIVLQNGGSLLLGEVISATNERTTAVTKIGFDGKSTWSKLLNLPGSGSSRLLSAAEATNGNILLTGINGNTTAGSFNLVMLDGNGTIIAQRNVNFGFNTNGLTYDRSTLILNKGQDSLLCVFYSNGQSNDPYDRVITLTTDNFLNIGDAAVVRMPPGSVQSIYMSAAKLEGNLLKLYGAAVPVNGCVTAGIPFPQLAELIINISTKAFISWKAFCAPPPGIANPVIPYASLADEDLGLGQNVFLLGNGNIIFTRAYLGVTNSAGVEHRLFSVAEFNSSFQPVKSEYLVTGNKFLTKSLLDIFIGSDGKKTISIIAQPDQKMYYAAMDASGNIEFQKKATLGAISPTISFSRALTRGMNGELEMFVAGSNNGARTIDQLKILPMDANDACFGVDTAFLSSIPATISPAPTIGSFAIAPIAVFNFPLQYTSADLLLTRQEICNIKRLCTTLALETADLLCNRDSIKVFPKLNSTCNQQVEFELANLPLSASYYRGDTLVLKFRDKWEGNLVAKLRNCPTVNDTIFIKVDIGNSKPTLGQDKIICEGSVIELKLDRSMTTTIWQDGSSNETFTAINPGSYHVVAMDNCGQTFRDTIVLKRPVPYIAFQNGLQLCKGRSLPLQMDVRLQDVDWTPSSTVQPQTPTSFILNPNTTTDYTITGKDTQNCHFQNSVTVVVKECNGGVYIPKAFTPNDDGKNDVFKVQTDALLTNFSLSIFNNWGEQVFVSRQLNVGWDGTFKSKKQNTGVFVWYCTYRLQDGTTMAEKGTVLLIR